MPFKLSKSSAAKLAEAHPDLQRLFNEAIKLFDFAVIEGHRDEARQNQLVDNGFSKVKWPNSAHNKVPSDAVDITPSPVNWKDKQSFVDLAKKVKDLAISMGIEVEWGGEFKGFFDGPHFQLRRKK